MKRLMHDAGMRDAGMHEGFLMRMIHLAKQADASAGVA